VGPPHGETVSTTTRRDWFWFAVGAIVVLAGVLRVAYLVTETWHNPLGDDASFYYEESRLLAHGKYFIAPFLYDYTFGQVRTPAATHPPLFTLVLTGANLLGVQTQNGAKVVCAIIGALGVIPVAMLGRAVGGRRTGVIAAALAAIYFPRLVSDSTVFAEVLYGPIVALFLLAMYRFLRDPSVRWAVIAGLFGGLAVATRGEGLILVAVVAAVVLLGVAVAWSRRLMSFAVIVGVSLLVISPWTVYNLTRFHDPVLISTNGGSVVAGANCDLTYYGGRLGMWIFACPHKGDRPTTGDDSQVSKQLQAQGVKYARQHLGRVPVVVLARIGRTFHLYRPMQSVRIDIGTGWRADLALLAYELLTAVAVVGAYVLWRRDRKALLPFVGATLAVVITVAGAYGNFRFRAPVDISFLVMGAVALDALIARLGAPRDVPTGDARVAPSGLTT
jgi:dolichyl-phosphate-mannose-protein mannosyltransferase